MIDPALCGATLLTAARKREERTLGYVFKLRSRSGWQSYLVSWQARAERRGWPRRANPAFRISSGRARASHALEYAQLTASF